MKPEHPDSVWLNCVNPVEISEGLWECAGCPVCEGDDE